MKENYGKIKKRMPGEDGGQIENGAVVGRNAVRELLRSGRSIDKILVQKGERNGSIIPILGEAAAKKVPIADADKNKLDQLSGGLPHQGIIAFAAEKEYVSVEDILAIARERGEKPFLLLADGVTDPHNLGAVIRNCDGAGVHGVIIPKRGSTGVTPTVAKASAGAIEHVAIAKVSNLSNTVEKLKKEGLFIVALEAGGQPYDEIDYDMPLALVIGSEGYGVGKALLNNCDFCASIPMYGHVNSLNVSCAAAVELFEIKKSRRNK